MCPESKSVQACTQAHEATQVKLTRNLSRAQTAEHTQVSRHTQSQPHSRAAHMQVYTGKTSAQKTKRIHTPPHESKALQMLHAYPRGTDTSVHKDRKNDRQDTQTLSFTREWCTRAQA